MNQNDILYALDGDERLKYSVAEALEFGLCEQNLDDIDYPILVHEYRRMKPSLNADRILEDVLDHLDENYCNPDGDSTEPTEEMKQAAKVFADSILSQYVSWSCECNGNVIEITRDKAIEILGLREEK